jgi:hypothetical protein
MNETKRNETKKASINSQKPKKNINETISFYTRQQSTKWQWRIEKNFTIFGNLGKLCAATSRPMYPVIFSDPHNVDPLLERKTNISISVPGFAA